MSSCSMGGSVRVCMPACLRESVRARVYIIRRRKNKTNLFADILSNRRLSSCPSRHRFSAGIVSTGRYAPRVFPANSLRHVRIITFASGDQFHYSCMLLHLEIYQLRTCSLKNLFALYRSLFAVKCSLYKCMCSQWNGRYSYGDVPVV